MTVVLALAAAICNALNVVTQHIASISDPGHSKGWRFARYLLSNPLWLFGWVALAGAFVFQAWALHIGQMSVVQPLLVTELVFALLLRRFWVHQQIRAVTWTAAAATCGTLALFIAVSEPTGGNAVASSSAWVGAVAATAGAATVLALCSLRGSPVRRAVLLGSAASVSWALVAAFIKATTDTLTQYGLGGMFTHWPVYALAVAGLAAEYLNQAAFHVGPLERVAAVPRSGRPDREHRAECLDLRRAVHRRRPAPHPGRGRLRRHVRRGDRPRAHCARHHGARPAPGSRVVAREAGYISSGGKKSTQLVCMEAPSAMTVAPQT